LLRKQQKTLGGYFFLLHPVVAVVAEAAAVRLMAKEHHLPYAIRVTQHYLPPDTAECAPP